MRYCQIHPCCHTGGNYRRPLHLTAGKGRRAISNSKNISQGTQDNPAIVQHFCVTKHLVAPLSIKAENVLPLIFTGITNKIPSVSTLNNFLFFFPFFFTTYNDSFKLRILLRFLRFFLCIIFVFRFSTYASPLSPAV